MATDADRTRRELRNVLAPSKLFDPVSEVLDRLNRRVLWESARSAKGKASVGEPCTIDREDLLKAVQVVLAQAATEIEKTLGSDAAKPVKKKAS